MQQFIYILDLFGTAVFAITGALVAGRKHMDIFGVLVLATVTALGGGTLRDVILGVHRIFWTVDSTYLFVAWGASIGTIILVRAVPIPHMWLLVSDAVGLAVFTLIGASKALTAGVTDASAVIMGIMTGVAGGVIRDMLSAEIPLVLRKEIYATASLCGALTYVLCVRYGIPPSAAVPVSFVTTLSIRLVAIQWNVSLPIFSVREDPFARAAALRAGRRGRRSRLAVIRRLARRRMRRKS